MSELIFQMELEQSTQSIERLGVAIKGFNFTSLNLMRNNLGDWSAELIAALGSALADSKVTDLPPISRTPS